MLSDCHEFWSYRIKAALLVHVNGGWGETVLYRGLEGEKGVQGVVVCKFLRLEASSVT